MSLDEHMGAICLQHACSAGVDEATSCRQAIAGFAMVSNSKTAIMPICASRVNNFILRCFVIGASIFGEQGLVGTFCWESDFRLA